MGGGNSTDYFPSDKGSNTNYSLLLNLTEVSLRDIKYVTNTLNSVNCNKSLCAWQVCNKNEQISIVVFAV